MRQKSTDNQTETEIETDADVLIAIAKQKENLEKTKSVGSKEKKKANIIKRFMVANCIFSWYVLPIVAGAPYWVINQSFISAMMFDEFMSLNRDSRKETFTQRTIEWIIFFLVLFNVLPPIVLNKTTLTESGFTLKEYPLLHTSLHDNRNTICLIVGIIAVIWFQVSLQRSRLRY